MNIVIYLTVGIIALIALCVGGTYAYYSVYARIREWQYSRSFIYVARVLLTFFEYDAEGGRELQDLVVKVRERRRSGNSTPLSTIIPDIQKYCEAPLPGASWCEELSACCPEQLAEMHVRFNAQSKLEDSPWK